jgi:hypothetical protein
VVSDWEELVARDARLSFGPGSAARARAHLDPDDPGAPHDDPRGRSVALFALGSGGGGADVPLLESSVLRGTRIEREAALHALGEMGARGWGAVERLLAGSPRELADLDDALLLAAFRAGRRDSPQARAFLVRRAEGGARVGVARALVGAPAETPLATDAVPGLATLYDLRWRAARRFGFVDGRPWAEVRLDALLADEVFLHRFVLSAATRLAGPTVPDHVIELLRGGGVGVVRGALGANPEVLVPLFEDGSWRPETVAEYRGLLEEIDERRLERGAEALLRAGFLRSKSLRQPAAILLLRAGAQPPGAWMASEIRGSVELQRALLESFGDRQDPAHIRTLVELKDAVIAEELEIPATLALARLGHAPARNVLQGVLSEGPTPRREEVVRALARVTQDAEILTLLGSVGETADLTPAERELVLLGHARAGVVLDRPALREWLRAGTTWRELGPAVVRLLARGAQPADHALFREVFPLGDVGAEDGTNIELALALLGRREAPALEILRSALWKGPWNRAVLAGGVLRATLGRHALRDELDRAPRGATAADLRRVGFALGEWGGLPAVEDLARFRDERDPALQGALLGALSTRGG